MSWSRWSDPRHHRVSHCLSASPPGAPRARSASAVSHFFRFWLWLTTGMITQGWAASTTKHHAKVEAQMTPIARSSSVSGACCGPAPNFIAMHPGTARPWKIRPWHAGRLQTEQHLYVRTQFKNANYKITNGLSTNKQLIIFNDRVTPFNKALVRKAITSAIDKKKLLQSIWGEYGTLLSSIMTPIDPGYEDLSTVNPYDPALAKRQLAKAGYSKGFTFTLDTPNDDPHPAAAAFIQSELAKVGITMKINIITTSQWFDKIYKKRDYTATIQNILSGRNISWYGNPDFFWGYSNPRVTNLINQSEQANTAKAQAALLKRANRLVAIDAASDWLYLYPLIVVSSSSLSGYPINGINSQFFVYNIVKN